MKQISQQTTLSTLGLQSLLPGLEMARNNLQRQIDEIRAQLGYLRDGHEREALPAAPAEAAEPEVDESSERRRAAALNKWNRMSRRQQKEHLRKMQAGRKAAGKRPVVEVKPVTDRPSFKDVEPPAGWMTTYQISKLFGREDPSYGRQLIKRRGWATRTMPRTTNSGKPPILVREADVMRFWQTTALPNKRAVPQKRVKGSTLPERLEDGWYTKTGAAKYLGVSHSQIERLQYTKELPFEYRQRPGAGGHKIAAYDPAGLERYKDARSAGARSAA